MPAEKLDAIDDELLAVIARIKGHPVQKAVPQPVSVLYPVSAAAEAAATRAWLKAEKEALENPEPGQKMPDGTIYLCRYKCLSRIFNVFAAAKDLPKTMEYADAVEYIAAKYNAHGYAGGNYENDKELRAAIKNGGYDGRWIIPPREVLHGKDTGGKITTPDNMLAHKDKGAFKGTFKTGRTESGSRSFPEWYWSSAENPNSTHVWDVCFHDGLGVPNLKNDAFRLSCRPVRLVPCK